MNSKRMIAYALKWLSHLCFFRVSMSAAEAKDILQKYSPKPSGSCIGENTTHITHDLHVVIPMYNVERYLSECLASVTPLVKSGRAYVQLIDDGSTDQSGRMADQYAEQMGENIEVIHQKNAGLSGARNAGLRYIRGRYVMLIDSDDYLPAETDWNALLEQISAYPEQVDIWQGNYTTVDIDSNTLNRVRVDGISGYPWGKLYHHSVLERFRFPENYWFEDTPVTMMLYGTDIKVQPLDEYIYCYRINPEGISMKSGNAAKSVDTYWITELCLEEFGAFGCLYDQRAYEYLLQQSITNFVRTRRKPFKVRKAILVLTAALMENYFSGFHSENHKEIEKAIQMRQWIKFELLAMAKQRA